jgi:outer membrane receptor protein involved in Fe transport
MRASPLGPALAGVPGGQLFGVSSAVPLLALGNRNLRVETVQGYEVGYKGLLGHRGVIAVDLYVSQMNDFVTNLLPGANPAYGAWTAPAAVPATARAGLEGAVRGAVGAGLTRLADGSTAFVVSLGNAGRADEWGTDIAAGYQLTDALTVEATYSYFNATVDASSMVPGDSILPNSPSNMGNVSLTYRRSGGTDVTLSTRLVEAFAWRGGIFSGRVPARQVVDLTAGRDLNAHTRLQIAATNLLDQRRYEVFGGSVVGRRLLGSVSLRF